MSPSKDTIFLVSSIRKPFITAITTISAATPSDIPSSEKSETTEMKLSDFFDFK
jgi:hypothetical protein